MSLGIYKPHYCPVGTQPHTSEWSFQMYGFLPSKAATAVLQSLPFDQVASSLLTSQRELVYDSLLLAIILPSSATVC